MEKQPVELKLDQYFTDEDIEQLFKYANLTKNTESDQEPQ